MKLLDLKGQRFGKLVVVRLHDWIKAGKENRKPRWLCQCDCGNTTVVRRSSLRDGSTKSCGCLVKECHATHRMCMDRQRHWLYTRWSSMITRCTNDNRRGWKDYGGRGIKVCDRWLAFENFVADVEPSYFDGATLERKDNDGPYSPENCIWATAKEQSRNSRRNRMVSLNGETMCVADWAEKLGINYFTLSMRLRKGWAPERALCPI